MGRAVGHFIILISVLDIQIVVLSALFELLCNRKHARFIFQNHLILSSLEHNHNIIKAHQSHSPQTEEYGHKHLHREQDP